MGYCDNDTQEPKRIGYTIFLLKKDLNAYWEIKIRASNGESICYDISKATYDTFVTSASAYAATMKAYKVAPQYTHFGE